MEYPIRKDIRLNGFDYSRNGAYFVTVCTKDRQHYMWDYFKPVGGDAHIAPQIKNDYNDISTHLPYELTDIGKIVQKYIVNIKGITKYVIMPNHLHIIIAIENDIVTDNGAMWASPPTQSLPKLIRSFKVLVTKELGFSPWQRNYYDRVIRNEHEYNAFWKYIETNPMNWESDELFTKE